MEKRFKRRTFFIRGSLQTKYAVIMLVLFVLASGIVWWEIYRNLYSLVADGIIKNPSLIQTLDNLTRSLALKVMLLLGGVWVFSILALHLVAGPIYRLELMLKLMRSGNFKERVHLRKDDELKNVATTFNETLESLQTMVLKDRALATAAAERLERLAGSAEGTVARDLRSVAAEVRSVTQDFTV